MEPTPASPHRESWMAGKIMTLVLIWQGRNNNQLKRFPLFLKYRWEVLMMVNSALAR